MGGEGHESGWGGGGKGPRPDPLGFRPFRPGLGGGVVGVQVPGSPGPHVLYIYHIYSKYLVHIPFYSYKIINVALKHFHTRDEIFSFIYTYTVD